MSASEGAPESPAGPLAGVRVVDLSSVVMVPWASQILGDLGADVITVEPPTGNVVRVMTPGGEPGLSGLAMNLLRNKRNVCLDLKHEHDRDVLLALLAGADVFVTNLRTSSLRRLGFDYEAVRKVNDSLVYCQATGFPQDSDRADDPAYDDIIQAMTGVADMFVRRDGAPAFVPMAMADKVGALTVVYAVLAALFHRERSGEGQHVEVPMIDAVTAFNLVEHGAGAIPRPVAGDAGYPRVLAENRRPQRTTDGWVSILPYSAADFVAIFDSVGRDVRDDPRFETTHSRVVHADEIYRELAEAIATKPTSFWLEVCRTRAVPYGPVVTLEEIVEGLADAEHPTAGRYKVIPQPVRWSTWSELPVRRHAAKIGQDNEEVLGELASRART